MTVRASRRTLAVSQDPAILDRIVAALPGSEVERFPVLESIDPATLRNVLLVIDASASPEVVVQFASQLRGDSRVIAVLPRGAGQAVIEMMQRAKSVVAMIAADSIATALGVLAARTSSGDVFGLDKLLAPGTSIHEYILRDLNDRADCVTQMLELAARSGLPRRMHTHVEQCLDEMVMNALYAAPVDERGKRVFDHITPQERANLTIDQSIVVQFASDGRQFAIAVRDAFGSLTRDDVLRVLAKGLSSPVKIDRKVSGSGVGLYLMMTGVAGLHLMTVPNVATEIACVFDLQNTQQLQELTLFVEPEDVSGELEGRPSGPVGTPRPLARTTTSNRRRRWYLVAGVAGLAAAAVVVVLPRLRSEPSSAALVITSNPDGATVELDGKPAGRTSTDGLHLDGLHPGQVYRVIARVPGRLPVRTVVRAVAGNQPVAIEVPLAPATVSVHSKPEGARVEVDGVARGETPLELTSPTPGANASLRLRRPGFDDAIVLATFPKSGETARIDQPLAMSSSFTRLRIATKPPGARLFELDAPSKPGDRTFTPAELIVPSGTPIRVVIAMPGRVAQTLTETPQGAFVERTLELAPAATLTIRANDGTATVVGALHCKDVPIPASCSLAPGSYTVELTAGGKLQKRDVEMKDTDVAVTF